MAVNDRFWPFWPWQAVKIGRISKIDPLLIELLIQIDSGATEEPPCIIFFAANLAATYRAISLLKDFYLFSHEVIIQNFPLISR